MFSKKLIGVIGAAALLTVFVAGPASAAPGDLVVTAGTLGFDGGAPTVPVFNPITLTGAPQLASLSIPPFTVNDATGSGAGWNVLLTVPNPTNGANVISSATNVAMSAPTVAAVGAGSMGGVTAAAGGATLNAGTKIVVATATNGFGMYLVSPNPVKVTVPVTAISGTYASAVTVAVVSGP
jgi:hypothetical protein